MDEIRREEESILREFRELGDPFAAYSYLLGLASLLPPCPEEIRTRANAVEGCQSSVWLASWAEEGRFRFRADSDTYVIRGLLYLLMNVLDGRPLAAAAAAELTFWRDPLLLGSFDSSRQRGIGYVAASLRRQAAELMRPAAAEK